jgi:hypothetical protein
VNPSPSNPQSEIHNPQSPQPEALNSKPETAPLRTQCTDSANSARSANPLPATENEKEPAPHSFCKSASAPFAVNPSPSNPQSEIRNPQSPEPETAPSEDQPDETQEPGLPHAPPRATSADRQAHAAGS